jgi:photosystem II stability/assembly factor-like uncharacterized protein
VDQGRLPSTNVNSVVCPPDSPQVLYTTLDDWMMSPSDAGVYKSTDGGVRWWYLPESNNLVCHVLTIDPKDHAVVYCGSFSYWQGAWAKRSRDAGGHWEDIHKILDRIVGSPWTDGLLLATNTFGGMYTVQRSTDDGLTWQGICGGEDYWISGQVLFHREDSLQAFAYLNYWPGGDGLGRTTDGGDSWEVVLPGLVVAFDQDPLNGDHWVAVEMAIPTDTVYLAESFDDGDTWRLSNLPGDSWWVRQVAFDRGDPQTIYLVVAELGVYRSTDGGQSWAPMNDGLADLMGVHEIFQPGQPPGELLCAKTDGLWRWTDQEAAAGPPDVSPGALRLRRLAPCPFHEKVRAQLSLGKSCRVEAGVYSLRGALVRNLLNGALEPGEYTLVWDGCDGDAGDAAPGAYLLVARTADEQAATRVLKVR